MMNAFRALVRKDLRIFFSDRRAVLMSFAAPIAIASFFGYLFGASGNRETSRIRVLAVDQDHSNISRAIIRRASADSAVQIKEEDAAQARAAVRKGDAPIAFIIPAGFGQSAVHALLGRAERPQLQLLYDPSHAPELSMVGGMLTGDVMRAVATGGLPPQPGRSGEVFTVPFVTHAEAVTSGLGVAYNGYAHAFAGMGVQFILFMGIEAGVSLLLLRQRGLWRRLRAAPVSRGLLLGSRAASMALIALIILMTIFGFARAVFGVRIEGSLPGFLAICISFALMTAAFGLLISALGKTPEATRGLSIFATLMMVMLGGAWVPAFLFPAWLQKLTLIVPTRWAMDGLDAMTWRGLGFSAALLPAAALIGATLLFGGIALARFRWEEEA